MNWVPREVIRADSLSLRQHQETVALNAVRALWRRRWLIGSVVLTALILGILYVQSLESKYTSETIIQVDFGRDGSIAPPAASPAALLDARAVIESDARIIGSLSTARRVVSRQNLTGDSNFTLQESRLNQILASIKLGKPVASQEEAAEIAALRLLEDLSVSNDRQSYLISIKYTHPNPDKAAKIANAFAAEYLFEQSHANYERAMGNRLWLSSQIASTRAALAVTERAIVVESSTVDIKARQARLGSLEAEANSIRDRLRTLTDNLQQARALTELKPASARVVVQAIPRTIPSSPNRTIALGVITAASGCLGILIALLLERRDTGFRTSSEISGTTDKPCLGEIPEISRAATPLQRTLLPIAIGETVTAGGLYNSCKIHKVVAIASAMPGEGKTFFIHNLAQCIASTGQRVLVIDASPCSMDRTDSAIPSLDEVLSNSAIEGRFLSESQINPISLIKRVSGIDGSRNINSAAFQDFLNKARNQFDVILIEAPPVLLLIDSWLVGSNVDAVFFLARWNKTPRATIEAGLRRLADLSVPVKGVILSRVNLNKRAQYPADDRPYLQKKFHNYYKVLS